MGKVLIVDEDAHIRRLIRQVLERAGYTVAAAATCSEVHDELARGLPDAIILDCLLGGEGSGLDLLRDLRTSPRTRNVPVILTTCIPEPGMDARLRHCGATAYLLKPFGPRDLLQAVAIAGGITAPATVDCC